MHMVAGGKQTMETLLSHYRTAHELGVAFIDDSLCSRSPAPVFLQYTTCPGNPAHYGRGEQGWFVRGGIKDGCVAAEASAGIKPGNRSFYSRFDFMSTQTGVVPGHHGVYELKVAEGTTADRIPVRLRIDNGKFVFLDINTNKVIAGDPERPLFAQSAGVRYRFEALFVQKGIYGRLSGGDLAEAIEISIPDRTRYIPGYPGLGMKSNPEATGGEAIIMNWHVTPVGPDKPLIGAIGDSITAGATGEPEAESYVAIVTAGLGQRCVLNVGSGGATTGLDAARFPIEIAPFRPRIVWIESGTNDICAGITAEPIYENMMKQVGMIAWGGIPVLSTVPPCSSDTELNNEQRLRLNIMIRESGYAYMDRHALLKDPLDEHKLKPEYDQGDGTHLTPLASRAVGEAALAIMRKL